MRYKIENISTYTNYLRYNVHNKLEKNRSRHSQYFSSDVLSKFMASMMKYDKNEIKILDPGTGVGSLFVACVDSIINNGYKPKKISITAYEIDESLFPYIEDSFKRCKKLCEYKNIKFSSKLIKKDFIKDMVHKFNKTNELFSHIIINPPYKKINAGSKIYEVLKNVNLQFPNLYAVFVFLSGKILEENGQIVYITPRSFCNGVYFQSFRKNLLQSILLKRIHVFDSRSSPFNDNGVLQENIIIYGVKSHKKPLKVLVSTNLDPNDDNMITNVVNFNNVVYPNDPQCFIHIPTNKISVTISKKIRKLESTLTDIAIKVSTGKVVDFRLQRMLSYTQKNNTAPLIRPYNISNKQIKFPVQSKKENYIKVNDSTKNVLIKNNNYLFLKRFTTKEENKRIVASIWRKNSNYSLIGIENRINYFHNDEKNINLNTLKGLYLFLSSTIVDLYFRQFSGNTQVNATDLQYLKYPTLDQLNKLGTKVLNERFTQNEIDIHVEKVLFNMNNSSNKIRCQNIAEKIKDASNILCQLGFPKQQQNYRSSLTLLALLDLKSEQRWKESKNPLIGITPMMEFFNKNYDKKYAPNSRETVRRQTIHQFLQAGLVIENPDEPKRPTNSGKTVYQINIHALEIIRTFNTPNWLKKLNKYKKEHISLQHQYANERNIEKIPLKLPTGKMLKISPGGQSILIEKIYSEFCPRFASAGLPLFIGDTAKKSDYYDESGLKKLGIHLKKHGKKPDMIIHDKKNNWLFVIEAVTSHGPIEPKRQIELKKIFSKSKIGIVYVTAFLNKKDLLKYFDKISWETEVWIANDPSHMIHFDGLKFLGPYT